MSDEPEFMTAADLRRRERADRFAIPRRPTRRFTAEGGLEYEGGTVFELTPEPARDDDALEALVESVLSGEPYRYGDWFDLPLALFLVHDDDTGDTFRVGVRDGVVELHVLPETEPGGLCALHERLGEAADCRFRVGRRTD